MTDLSSLSDEELRRIAEGQRPFNNVLANMSDEQLLAAAGRGKPDDNLPAKMPFGPWETPIPLPTSLAAGLVGAGRTFDRQIAGAQQPFYAATGQKGKSEQLAADQADKTSRYEPLTQAHPVATFLGEVAPTLAAANPWAMAALGANEYGSIEDRGIRGAAGYVGGKIGQGVARMFGPESMAGNLPNLSNQFFPSNTTNKWGIPLSVGQATQYKPAQIAESVIGNLPFGGAINKAKDRTFSEFNRAISNTFGENTSNLAPDVLGSAQGKIGGKIGALADRNTLVPDFQLTQDLARVGTKAQKNLSTGDAKIVDNWISELLSKQQQGGGIPGTNYRAWRSDVGELAKSSGGTLGNVLGDLRQSVTKAMDRSISPADAKEWAKANHDYFNVKQVAEAVKSMPDNLSPAQLLHQVNMAQKNARFGGGNDLAELAQWAKQTLPDKIPNSGTAQRLLYQKLLTNPVTAVAGLAGAGAGANQLDIDPRYAAFGLLPLLAARGMAGQPVSEFTRKLLMRAGGGGLLGLSGLATE